MITLPRLKKYVFKDGEIDLKQRVGVFCENAEDIKVAINILNSYLNDFNITAVISDRKAADIVLSKASALCKAGFYSISIAAGGIEATYSDAQAAGNAAATLIAINTVRGDRITLPFCEIEDYPDSLYRGFMMDIARQYIQIDEIKSRIRLMARAKMNVLHLHLLDTERYALVSEAVPDLNLRPIFKQYTKVEMRELVEYAASFGIWVIPEIDYPGHALFTLERLPEYMCEVNGKREGIWTLCLSNEKTYVMMEALVKELTEIFDCEYIHWGGDELSFSDILHEYPGYEFAWDKCDKCTALMKEKNYADVYELYCHFIKRMHAILAKYGKKLMIWNDSIDISRTNDLPRDILIQFWRIALPGRGPYKGCSMQRFAEEGFKIVNAFFEETYLCDYVKEDRLKNWTLVNSPEISDEYKHMVVGGEFCAWGIRNHFDYTLPPAFLLFADRFWNRQPLEIDSEVMYAVSRQLIWTREDLPNVFELLGGCIMPVVSDNKYAKPCGDIKRIESVIEYVTRVHTIGRCDVKIVKPIIRCLEDLKKSRFEEAVKAGGQDDLGYKKLVGL